MVTPEATPATTAHHWLLFEDDGKWGCDGCEWIGAKVEDYWTSHEAGGTMAISPSSIPDEIVEIAARAVWAKSVPGADWAQGTRKARAVFLQDARWALEAAAPHLLAQGWDEGHDACADEYVKYENPYRKSTK